MSGRRADIHFHLLPGVDDGAANLEETVELARLAEADGTGVIVATPHVRSEFVTDVSDLPDRVAEVRARLRLEEIDVDVRCGGELGHEMVGRLGQSDLDTIAVGPRGSSWILLEAPFEGLGEELHVAADELRRAGEGFVGFDPGAGADPHGLGAASAAGARGSPQCPGRLNGICGLRSAALAALQPHAFDDVRNGLAAIDCLLQGLEDVLPTDHDHRVRAALEQGRDRLA